MSGTELLNEGTPIPVKGGGTVNMLFDMYALVKLEEEFGGLNALKDLIPSSDDGEDVELEAGMFTNLMKLFHLGLLHLGWDFETACHALLPQHLQVYLNALGKELNFGDGSGGGSGDPKSPGTNGTT